MRHGLTARVVVLPTEDLAAYQRFSAEFLADLAPETFAERQCAQNVIDTQWRLNRVRGLEDGTASAEARVLVMQTLDSLGIAHLADRPIHELSLGEKKRVALAGALVLEPEIILLDEPTAGLDFAGRGRVDPARPRHCRAGANRGSHAAERGIAKRGFSRSLGGRSGAGYGGNGPDACEPRAR
jgi:hypothetical protein